jgi:hypothetical protein
MVRFAVDPRDVLTGAMRGRRAIVLAALAWLGASSWASVAWAQGGAASEAAVAAPSAGEEEGEGASVRFHGSVLLFDQSVTTTTVGLGQDYQTANPVYEWWIAFKPRYYLFETRSDSLSLALWANLFLELTDSDTTTRRREPLLGPTYAWATYAHTLRAERSYRTIVSIGPRLTLPTDKAAWDTGQRLGLGGSAELSQTFPLAGKHARALQGLRLALGAIYTHTFSEYRSRANDDLARQRQDVNGRPLIDPQLGGAMITADWLTLAFSGELQVLRKLEFSASYVVLNKWGYTPSAVPLGLSTGPDRPAMIDDPTTYSVSTWLTSSVSYLVVDELTVSLGYYNLANQLALDGTRRNPLWSPSARLFLTLTANLDAIYQRAAGRRRS